MFFPYFKIKQMFQYLYVDMLDNPTKYKDGRLGSYIVIGDTKYSYIIKINKTNKETNSVLGLYINIDLFIEPNDPYSKPEDIKHAFSIEYFYNWESNYYQQTKSYTSVEVKSKFWKNPLKWFNSKLIDLCRVALSESIELLDFKHVFNYNESEFNNYFVNSIDRTIKSDKHKNKKTSKKTTKPKAEKPKKAKPRPKKQSAKQKKNLKGE